MSLQSRVVWKEGMHLSQHHFQLQARYFEEAAAFQARALHFASWGVAGVELDQEAIRNGTVRAVHVRGIFPDGLAVHVPDGDPAPEPIELAGRFSPTADRQRVFLAIPPHRPGSANCTDEADMPGASTRYLADVRAVRDELGGEDQAPVAFARKNLRLVLEGETAGDDVLLPLARVRRDGSGHFVYDDAYLPPLVQIGASGQLMDRLTRIVEMLEARAEALTAERAASRGQTDYGSREVATFWLAHAVHAALPGLRHQLAARSGHPERLFVELARLAGALTTFSLDGSPRDLPLYDHEELDASLAGLERAIRSGLQVFLPQNRIQVPLDATRELLRTGAVRDPRAFKRSHWFLGVRSAMPEGEAVTSVPRLLKICSAKHIARLVKEAYPGIGMRHVPTPPTELAPRLGSVYFALDRTEPCWSSIVETGEVGVYVPAALPGADIELVIVLEE